MIRARILHIAAVVILAVLGVCGTASVVDADGFNLPDAARTRVHLWAAINLHAEGQGLGASPSGSDDRFNTERAVTLSVSVSDVQGPGIFTAVALAGERARAGHDYDAPGAARAAAIDPGTAGGLFPQFTADGSGVPASPVLVGDSATTPPSITSTPSGTGQRIYRAVEPDELADLMGRGQYRNIPGIGDGKYFFPTRQQADAFAEMMTKRGMGGPYCTTSGCIPADVLRQVERISPAGEGAAYYIPDSLLPYIDDILIHGG